MSEPTADAPMTAPVPSPIAAPALPTVAPEAPIRFAFRGSGGRLFFIMLKTALLSLVTLGIYYPWGKTERRQYMWANLEVDGSPLRFTGTGTELFIGYLKVLFVYALLFGGLTAVQTLAPALAPAVSIATALAFLILVPYAIYGARRYLLSRTQFRGIRLGMTTGGRREFVRRFLPAYFLTIFTAGLATPYLEHVYTDVLTRHTTIGNTQLWYAGRAKDQFRAFFITVVLTPLTLGLALFWYQAWWLRYRLTHTELNQARFECTVTGRDLLVVVLATVFGTALTLGLAMPWLLAWQLRFITERTTLVGDAGLERIRQSTEAEESATADGLADAMDLGFGL